MATTAIEITLMQVSLLRAEDEGGKDMRQRSLLDWSFEVAEGM